MSGKKHTAEQIVNKLREAALLSAKAMKPGYDPTGVRAD
jgi:hypothetical protein